MKMEICFTKMHGIGNDYIYVNCLDRELENPSDIAIKMSPRRFSVGADGLIMICKSDVADAKMRIFNADGSEGKMCGNGIRCVGKYLYDNRIVTKKEVDIETNSGVKHLTLHTTGDSVDTVSVDMGMATFSPKKIPVLAEKEMINAPLIVNWAQYNVTCVSVGNPHAVVFVENVDYAELEKVGPLFEKHELFPERINTEFVEVIDMSTLKMRVWERGSGETWACGTGACASVCAAVINGHCEFDTPITVKLKGGDLTVTCSRRFEVRMEGMAEKVYDGVFAYED